MSLPLSLAFLLPLKFVPFPSPWPCPLPCPVSLPPLPLPWPSPCACPPALLLVLAPCTWPCPPLSLRAPRPFPCFRLLALLPAPWPSPGASPPPPLASPPLVVFCPSPCASVAGTPPRPIAVNPRLDHAPLQLQQRDAHRRALKHRGADGLRPPLGEGGLGWVRLGGSHVGVAGLGEGAVLGPSLLSAAAAAVPSEAPGARAGPVPRASCVPGAVGRLAGAEAAAPCAYGASPWGGLAVAATLAEGAASPASTSSGAGDWGSLGAVWGCSAGGPTGTAASASCRSSRSAGVSPAHPSVTGERELDWRWWRSSSWGKPSESDIATILVGVRGCRRARPTTSQCIGGVGWTVPCAAGWAEGGALVVVVAQGGQGPVAIHRHWGGRLASHSTHTLRHSSQSGLGLRALGPVGPSGVAGGSRTRWTPIMVVTSWVRRKACTLSRASGTGRGGARHRRSPVEVGGGGPQAPLRGSAAGDDEEEQAGARALLPGDLTPLVGASGPGEGG